MEPAHVATLAIWASWRITFAGGSLVGGETLGSKRSQREIEALIIGGIALGLCRLAGPEAALAFLRALNCGKSSRVTPDPEPSPGTLDREKSSPGEPN